MTGTDFAKKIKDAITTVEACDYPVYFRAISKSGAGIVLGVPDTITNTDTLITPTPVMEDVSFEELQGTSGLLQMGDKKLIMSSTQTVSDITTKHIVYNSKVYRVVKHEPARYDGQIVAHFVYIRAM
jgi:hypothetical protein